MKVAATYVFDALVNIIGQSILFLIGMFVWVNPVSEILWVFAAVGFAAFLAIMERGAEKRRGAVFRHYLLFSVLPVNIIALIVAAVTGVIEYNRWTTSVPIYVYNPFYPIWIAAGTVFITLAFVAVNRLTRQKA